MKNARIDWFRAVRVFSFGLGWQSPCSGGESATIGTPSGRDAELLPSCGSKGVLHGSERGPQTPNAGILSLPGLVFLFAISLIAFTPWNGAKADTPAVTNIRIGVHDFGIGCCWETYCVYFARIGFETIRPRFPWLVRSPFSRHSIR